MQYNLVQAMGVGERAIPHDCRAVIGQGNVVVVF